MTLAFAPLPLAHPARQALASDEIRRSLHAMLRRRLPAQEVDDVAQTILCDAMAAERIPADPEELRRWLSGIARHKVVDFHRRAGRQRPTEDVDGVSLGPSYEDREVLQQLLAEPRTRRDAATFEWLVREHDGEHLQDIAREEKLPPPVVRQRVSRLRRALRSRWSTALLLLLAAFASTMRRSFSMTTIAPEPASSATELRPPTLIEAIEGAWVLESVRPSRELTRGEQRLVDLGRDAVLRVHEGNVTIKGGAFERSWNIGRTDGTRIVLVETGGRSETVELSLSGGRMTVRFRGGSLVLRRATF